MLVTIFPKNKLGLTWTKLHASWDWQQLLLAWHSWQDLVRKFQWLLSYNKCHKDCFQENKCPSTNVKLRVISEFQRNVISLSRVRYCAISWGSQGEISFLQPWWWVCCIACLSSSKYSAVYNLRGWIYMTLPQWVMISPHQRAVE